MHEVPRIPEILISINALQYIYYWYIFESIVRLKMYLSSNKILIFIIWIAMCIRYFIQRRVTYYCVIEHSSLLPITLRTYRSLQELKKTQRNVS